jgi:hypothetical protein
MTESAFSNVSVRRSTRDRLKLMAYAEGRSIAGLVALLAEAEYKRWIASRRKSAGASA